MQIESASLSPFSIGVVAFSNLQDFTMYLDIIHLLVVGI